MGGYFAKMDIGFNQTNSVLSRTKSNTKTTLQNSCFGAINFVNIANNHFTNRIPSRVLLQTATNQWQQHCKVNILVELYN